MEKMYQKNKVGLVQIVIGRIFEKKHITLNRNFPLTLNGYNFKWEIKPKYAVKNYKFAVYANSKGQESIAKMWNGESKNITYYWLLNEINAYIAISEIYKKNGKLIKQRYPDIKIPRFICFETDNNRLILLIQKINGKALKKVKDDKFKVRTYEDVVNYFRLLDKLFSKNEIDDFMLISSNHILLAFPYLMIRVLIRRPEFIKEVAKTVWLYITNIMNLSNHRRYSFVHRDLFDNILIDKRKIYIIDFQVAAKTLPFFELINIDMGLRKYPKVYKKFHERQIFQKIKRNKNSRKLYKLLTSYSILYDMVFINNMTLNDAEIFLKNTLSAE